MARQETENRYNNRYYAPYVGGSAVPERAPERRVKKRTRSKAEPRTGIGTAIAAIFLFVAVFSMVALFLGASSEMTKLQKTIETKELELSELKAKNEAAEIRLNKSIDLDEIYKVATTELGMVYPSDDQVIYYNRSDGGYVRQYEDIPEG